MGIQAKVFSNGHDKDIESPRVVRTYDDGYIVRHPYKHEIEIIKSERIKSVLPYSEDLEILYDLLESNDGIYIGEYQNKMVAYFVNPKWGNMYNGAMFYVFPEYRGKGFGWRIKGEVAMGRLKGDPMEIDAIQEKWTSKYETKGWNKKWETLTYEGTVLTKIEEDFNKDIRVIKACDIDFEKLIEYDNRCFVSQNCPLRRRFLKEITFVRDGTSYVALNGDNEIIGMGYQRPCAQENLVQIGPLYADSKDVARSLLVNLFNDVEEKTYNVYVWSPNIAAQELFESFGCVVVVKYNRMYINSDPQECNQSMFCFTSPDICHF